MVGRRLHVIAGLFTDEIFYRPYMAGVLAFQYRWSPNWPMFRLGFYRRESKLEHTNLHFCEAKCI